MASTELQIDDAVAKRHVQNTDTALGAMSADLDANLHKIIALADPTGDRDAAHKKYVDDHAGGNVVGPSSAIDSAIPLFDGITGLLVKDSTRLIEDILSDGPDIPDGHAIKVYGDANWSTGSGDVIGPASNTDDYVPQWNGADSKTLKNGFAITAAGKALIDDANVAAQRTTLELLSAALRAAEDTLTDGDNLPDGHAIKTYGDANWADSGYTNLTQFVSQTAWRLFYSNGAGDVTELALGTSGQYLKANGISSIPTWDIPAGSGNVVGPATHAASYVPQWNGTPNSKTLVEGFAITVAGKALIDDASAAAQRTTLGLLSAALRVAEDTLTDGDNLPDGHAIKIYGDANWSSGGGDVVGPAGAINNAISLFNGTTGKLIKDSTRLIEDTLTDGSNLPDGHAIKVYGDANWDTGGYTNLTEFVSQTAWRLFYSDNLGDVTELALGTSGQYLKSGGQSSIPTWDTPAGSGDVIGPATHAANYVPQWNGTPNSKTLVQGFIITTAGKNLIDDASTSAQRATLGLGSAATRNAEDTMTDGGNLPDGHAIKTYGDTNWSSGGGDVVGPSSATSSTVVLFDGTTGKLIKSSGRFIEDTMTDSYNLPDGHAIKVYGDAHWAGGGGLWTDSGNYIYADSNTNVRVHDSTYYTGSYPQKTYHNLYIQRNVTGADNNIYTAARLAVVNTGGHGLGWPLYVQLDDHSTQSDGSTAVYAKTRTFGSSVWAAAIHGEIHNRESGGTAIAGNFEMWNKHSSISAAYGVVSGITAWSGNPGSYYNGQAAFLVNSGQGKKWKNGLQFNSGSCLDYEIKSNLQLRISTANGASNVILHSANIMKKTGTYCTIGTSANYFDVAYINTVYASCGVLTCDYVFENDYKLISLDNLKSYLKKTYALPGMTTNTNRDQLDVGKATEELLVKLEEQTLYILQLHERIKKLEN